MPPVRFLALEMNDAAVAVADDTGVLEAQPAYTVVADTPACFGFAALPRLKLLPRHTHVRYFRELSLEEMPRPLRAFQRTAEILSSHMRGLWMRHGTGMHGVICATPPFWTADQINVMLTVFGGLGIPVLGLADAAVAATRNEYPGRELLNLDATLHGLTLTHIRQAGQASLGEREELPSLGVEPLLKLSTEYLARRFVECARFDPLHDLASEQRLFMALPGWLERLRQAADAELVLETGGHRYTATASAADFKARVAQACAPLVQKLRARISARGPHVLQVHHRFADFPGTLEVLLRLPRTEVVVLEPGAAARGLYSRFPIFLTTRPGMSVVTSLPWDRPAADRPLEPALPEIRPEQPPSHVLVGHRAYRLADRPFRVGAELGPGDYGVALDPRVRGVSRNHCSLRQENGAIMLFDHSRYGTELNGHRVEGAAMLEAGDVITLGSPPVELRLIAEVEGHGP